MLLGHRASTGRLRVALQRRRVARLLEGSTNGDLSSIVAAAVADKWAVGVVEVASAVVAVVEAEAAVVAVEAEAEAVAAEVVAEVAVEAEDAAAEGVSTVVEAAVVAAAAEDVGTAECHCGQKKT